MNIILSYLNFIKILFICSIAIFFTCILYFFINSPLAFQKIMSIKMDENHSYYNDIYQDADLKHIINIIGDIPYNREIPNWEVHPKKKYENSIINGFGNCSNYSQSLIYELTNLKQKGFVFYLLYKDLSFLDGSGHAAVQIKYNNENIIIDINEAGIPLNNETYLSIDDFDSITSENLNQLKLNKVSDQFNQYFNKEIISKSEIGKVRQKELEDYFRFIENIYVPLGNSKLEKIFYDSLALLFGFFPSTYVSKEFFIFFKNEIFFENLIAHILFITFHLNYIFILLLITMKIVIRFKDRS